MVKETETELSDYVICCIMKHAGCVNYVIDSWHALPQYSQGEEG